MSNVRPYVNCLFSVYSCPFNLLSLGTDEEIPLDQVSPVFAEKMTQLRRVLADEILLEPHHVGSQPVFGGAVLASLLTEVVSAINKGTPNLQPSRLVFFW